MIIPILPLTDFDLTGLDTAGSTAIPVLQDLDTSRWGRGVLVVRVHAVTFGSVKSSVRVEARITARSEQDPRLLFRGPIVGAVKVTSATATAPQILRCPIFDMGGALSFFVTATQGVAKATLHFTISADLVVGEHFDDWEPIAALGSKLTLFLDEHDLVQVSTAYSDWGDQSPAVNDFKQPTATLRPASGSAINTYPAPRFDGTDDALACSQLLSSFVNAGGYHVFAVIRADNVAGSNATPYFNDAVIADVNLGWWGLYLKNVAGTLQVLGFHWGSGSHVAIGTGLSLQVDNLIEWSFDGSTVRCQVGGDTIGTASGASIGDVTNPVSLGIGASGSLHLNGAIAAIVVCNQYLSPAERQNVRGYLASKYGVPS